MKTLIAIAMIIMVAMTAAAEWQPTGVSGGGSQYGHAISPHDPQLMFVACDMSNTFRSTDGGRTFTMIDMKQLPSTRYGTAHFHPTDPNVVLMPSAGGLYASNDAGISWTPMFTAKGRVDSAFISRSDSNVVLAGSVRGIYRATDGGRVFGPTSGAPTAATTFAFFEGEGNIFAASSAGIFRSTDTGATWTNVSPTAANWFEGLCGADKGGQTTLFVSANSSTHKGLVYKSVDLGETWQPIGNFSAGEDLFRIVCAENDPDTIFLNSFASRMIFKSTDGGTTWKGTYFDRPAVAWGWLDYKFGGVQSWGGRPVKGIGICPTDSRILAVGNTAATYRTDDGGTSWRECYGEADGTPSATSYWKQNGANLTSAWHYYVDPFDPSRHQIAFTDILFAQSETGGNSWKVEQKGNDLYKNTTYQCLYHPTTAGTEFCATANQHDIPYTGMIQMGTGGGGIIKTANYGASWTYATNGLPMKPATSVATDGTRLYVAMMGDGVYKSSDWGKTWTKTGAIGTSPTPHVFNLTVDSAGIVYCTIAGKTNATTNVYDEWAGLYRSTDQGATWKAILPLHSAHRLTVDPTDNQRLYLAVWDGVRVPNTSNGEGGIWTSTDGGSTWRQERFNWKKFPAWTLLRVSHVLVDPIDPTTLYAAWYSTANDPRWKGGILVSHDRGLTWQDYDSVPFIKPTEIAIYDGVMYVPTFGSGVWQKDLKPNRPLTIQTTAFVSGTTDQPYSRKLSATGGKAPYSWKLTAGTLPDGLRLTGGGEILGSPLQTGNSVFILQATDATGNTASRAYSLTVNAPDAPLVITVPQQLPTGKIGVPYQYAITATGGTLPYACQLGTAKQLPAGLSLSADCVITGTPTATASKTDWFVLNVIDTAGTKTGKTCYIVVLQ